MTTEEYEQLLAEIREARANLAEAMDEALRCEMGLQKLLKRLDQEESRVAREALTSMHSASRKLVVGE